MQLSALSLTIAGLLLACSAAAFFGGRARMSDEEWVAMGRHESIAEFFQEFAARFPPA